MSLRELEMRCPVCRQTDYLDIECTCMAHVDDEGTDFDGDVYWDDDSRCACPKCGWSGRVWRTRKCDVCNERGYISAFNTDTQQNEIQRCDFCERYKTDEEARLAADANATGGQAPLE